MELTGDTPDVIVGCVGGGSNFAGLTFPFVRRVLRGEARTRLAQSRTVASSLKHGMTTDSTGVGVRSDTRARYFPTSPGSSPGSSQGPCRTLATWSTR